MRTLATNDRNLRLVDLLETQHVAAHPSTFPFRPSVCLVPPSFGPTVLGRLVACIVNTPQVLAASPPPGCTLVMARTMAKVLAAQEPGVSPNRHRLVSGLPADFRRVFEG